MISSPCALAVAANLPQVHFLFSLVTIRGAEAARVDLQPSLLPLQRQVLLQQVPLEHALAHTGADTLELELQEISREQLLRRVPRRHSPRAPF